jgi:hypothetical protein
MRVLIRREDGIAVAMVVMVMALIAFTAGAALVAAAELAAASNRDGDSTRALEAANAGAQVAEFRLSAVGAGVTQCFTDHAVDAASCPATDTESLGNGTSATYYVSPVLSASDPCVGPTLQRSSRQVLQRCIVATGQSHGVQRRVQVRIAANPPPSRFPTQGLFTLTSITASGTFGVTGNVASNGTISLPGSATVTGTVTPNAGLAVASPPDAGPFETSAQSNDNAQLNFSGQPLSLNTQRELVSTNKVGTAASPWLLPGGTYNFCRMRFPNDTYIKVGPNAAGDDHVHIYLDSPARPGAKACASGTEMGWINNTGKLYVTNDDPAKLQIDAYGCSNCEIVVNNQGTVTAAIYAPNSKFTSTGVGTFNGGIVANEFRSSNTFRLDASGLSGIIATNVTPYFVTAWRECRPAATPPESGC